MKPERTTKAGETYWRDVAGSIAPVARWRRISSLHDLCTLQDSKTAANVNSKCTWHGSRDGYEVHYLYDVSFVACHAFATFLVWKLELFPAYTLTLLLLLNFRLNG